MKKNSFIKLFTTVLVSLLLCFQMLPTPSSAATVKLNKTKKTLTAGETCKLNLKNASGTIKWSSTSKKVATVSKKGLVTAIGAGTCKIKAKYKSKTYTCKITVKKLQPIAYGDQAFPEFSLTDTKGNTIDNSVFSKSYITIVNFWEPWCGPCVMELPDLQAIYKNYKSKGVNIIGIFGTASGADYEISEAGLKYTLIYDSSLYYELGNGYVPYTVFVDGYGNIISSLSDSGSKSYESFKSIITKYLP